MNDKQKKQFSRVFCLFRIMPVTGKGDFYLFNKKLGDKLRSFQM